MVAIAIPPPPTVFRNLVKTNYNFSAIMPTVEEMEARFPPYKELDDSFSEEAKKLDRCAAKASRLAIIAT